VNAWKLVENAAIKYKEKNMKIEMISHTHYLVSGVHIEDFLNQRYCVFDFEATGINHDEEYITQIGAVIIENKAIQKTYSTYVKSPKPIPPAIEEYTGIYNRDIENAPEISFIFDEFKEFIGDSILVTHAGYEFDLPLLRNECRRNDLPYITNKAIDTKALFSYLHPEIEEIIWTDYLIKYYQVQDNDLKRHDALGDSILISRIFQKIAEEFVNRDIVDISLDEVRVKRFQSKPLT
jgi:DNA polymerase III subunit epsilon